MLGIARPGRPALISKAERLEVWFLDEVRVGQTGRVLSTTEVHDWKRYQTRVMSSANQVNLDFEDATPELVAGFTRAIAGIF